MKARLTRLNQRPDPLLTGLVHHEGEMVTASDLNDHGFHATFKREELGLLTLRDGVPAQGGAITIDGADRPSLQPGYIVADGVVGQLRAGPNANPALNAALFESQADLPQGPDWPEGETHLLYADIWTTAQSALENPDLLDSALHGADTAMRTRTMCQVKAAPADAAEDLLYGAGRFPRIGNGELSAVERAEALLIDDCDPCKEVIPGGDGAGPPNALVRFEIVALEGQANAPTRLHLAWSMENASITLPVTFKDQIKRAGAVYQYYSEVTEAHRGAFADDDHAKPAPFVDDFDNAPAPAEDYDNSPWPFVRRWDGWLNLDIAGDDLDATMGAGFAAELNDGVLKLSTDYFEASLNLRNKSVLIGDYWLLELRRFAEEGDKVRVPQATPNGIVHHYCPLFRVNANGDILALSDTDRRRLSFPALSNLPASHIGLDHRCEKLFGDAENVQDALRNLCAIEAEDIAFDDQNCPRLYAGADTVQQALDNLCGLNAELIFFNPANCPRLYGNADTVQEALDALCQLNAGKIPFNPNNCPDLFEDADTVQAALDQICKLNERCKEGTDFTILLRHLFDWGVVCGILPGHDRDSRFNITKGYFIDKMGRFERYKGEQIDLNDLLQPDQLPRIHFDGPEELRAHLLKGEVCLCLAYDNDEQAAEHNHPAGIYVHLVARRDLDPLVLRYTDVIRDCLEEKKSVDFIGTLEGQAGKKRAVRHTLAMMVKESDLYEGAVAFDEEEFGIAGEFITEVQEAFNAIAENEEQDRLKYKIERARVDYNPDNYVGEARLIANARLNKILLELVARADKERRERCVCESAFPPCPPTQWGEFDRFVPIACLRGGLEDNDYIFIEEVCAWRCRKQAITLKTAQYWGLWEPKLTQIVNAITEQCCYGQEGEPPITWTPPDKTYVPYDPNDSVNWAQPKTLKEISPDYSHVLNIKGQPLDEAQAKIEGFGVNLGYIIDTATDEGQKRLRETTAKLDVVKSLEDPSVRPSDEVALVVNNGVAKGYIVTKKGDGAYPYAKLKAHIASPDGEAGGAVTSVPDIDMSALVERLEAARKDSASLSERLETLVKTRSDTSSAVAETRADLNELTPAVSAARTAVKTLTDELESLTSERAAYEAEIKELKADLTEMNRMRASTESVVNDLRSDMRDLVKSRDELMDHLEEIGSEYRKVERANAEAKSALKTNQDALTEIKKAHEKFLVEMKGDQPIGVIRSLPPATLERLSSMGIRSVSDIARANDTTFRALEMRDVMSRTEARAMRDAAKGYLRLLD